MSGLLLYLATGAVAGLLAGLFGVGGGLIIVPALAFSFASLGFDNLVLMHLAVGTSLATIVFTSLSSIWAHHRRGAVDWPTVFRLTPGIVLGALGGAVLARFIPSDALRTVFSIFELAVALQLALNLKPSPHRALPGRTGSTLAGGVIGMISALVGVGGGTLTVPFLLWCNVVMQRAVATSAACGLPIALAGAIGFLAAGWGVVGLPRGSSGYLYWPAFVGVVAASVLFAPLGARLAHTLPAARLKRLFSLLLLLLGLRMFVG